MSENEVITPDEAARQEARPLAENYGLTHKAAVELIADVRKAGGIDRYLREQAKKGRS